MLSEGPGEAGSEIKDKGAVEYEQQQQGQGGGCAVNDLHRVVVQKAVQDQLSGDEQEACKGCACPGYFRMRSAIGKVFQDHKEPNDHRQQHDEPVEKSIDLQRQQPAAGIPQQNNGEQYTRHENYPYGAYPVDKDETQSLMIL